MANESKGLELAIAQLERQFGSGSIMKLGNFTVESWPSRSGRAHV